MATARGAGRAGVDQRGASLVIVLALVTSVAIVIGSLLSGSATSQKSTVVSHELNDAVYAADAGVELGVSQLREAQGLCPDIAFPAGAAAPGQAVTVTCTDPSGGKAPLGSSSWAVVTFDPAAGSLSTQSGNGVEKQVSGRTFVNGGLDLQAKLRVNFAPPDPGTPLWPFGDGVGYVYQAKDRCQPKPANLVTPNFLCSSLRVEDIDPKPPLPPKPANRPRGPASTVVSGGVTCGIFLPGTYSDSSPSGNPPNPLGLLTGAGTANYLVSGVYYFHNLGEINLNDYRVFGGDMDGARRAISSGPCAADPVGTADKGVQIVLGGDSWLNVNRADAEFAAYKPAAGGKGRGVSIRTVPDPAPGGSGYTASRPGGTVNGRGLTVATGNNPHFAVHGLVYAPNAAVELYDTNTSASQILGGVMAWNLKLNASASGSGLVVQVTGQRPKQRSNIVIEATAPVSPTKSVKSRAVVDVNVDPPSRVISDGRLVASSTTVRSAAPQFLATDVGSAIFGGTIPAKTYITQFISPQEILISDAATASEDPVQITIDPSTRTVTNGTMTNGGTTVASSTIKFTADDVGATIVSVGTDGNPDGRIPPGTAIDAVTNATTATLSQPVVGNPVGQLQSGVKLSVIRRKMTVTVESWRVENP